MHILVLKSSNLLKKYGYNFEYLLAYYAEQIDNCETLLTLIA